MKLWIIEGFSSSRNLEFVGVADSRENIFKLTDQASKLKTYKHFEVCKYSLKSKSKIGKSKIF